MTPPLATGIGVAVAAIAAVFAFIYAPGSAARLERLFSVPDARPIDFSSLRKSSRPNQYLVLPDGTGIADPDTRSPVFDAAPAKLAATVRSVVAAEPDTELRQSHDPLVIEALQRTPRMRFPDLVTIEVIPAGDARSALAIYSRSVYGYSDRGVNAARITRWLSAIRASAKVQE